MKTYPKIRGRVVRDVPVYVFDKLDGSNVRAEFNRSGGWTKFGRRRGLLDDTHPMLLSEAEACIRERYGEPLARIFTDQGFTRATAFFEFHGPNSFAGYHADEPHEVTLLDVAVHPRGLLEPDRFLELFGHLPTATLLHHGRFTTALQASVEAGLLVGMTDEGVVCKGPYVTPGRPLMFKHKSRRWLERLRRSCRTQAEFERRT